MSKQTSVEPGPIQGLEAFETIGPAELAELLGRSVKSIQIDTRRKPHTLPPLFVIPGTKLLRWRKSEIREWMQELSDAQARKRAAQQAFAERFPLPKRRVRKL
jgi:predicted DNA-binding transcriptional regulator AlpA